ncbi:hypothetical protein [Shewanella sp. KX20019]|nr:hypothetical protein [Shewanella sp. KX20019]
MKTAHALMLVSLAATSMGTAFAADNNDLLGGQLSVLLMISSW